jgi:hypothetical protein
MLAHIPAATDAARIPIFDMSSKSQTLAARRNALRDDSLLQRYLHALISECAGRRSTGPSDVSHQNFHIALIALFYRASLLYALRNSGAVNRLAMMSVILGIGALVTGYYGMNIPHLETVLTHGAVSIWSLVLTSLMALASLWFIVYIVASNWMDYRASILPHRYRKAIIRVNLRKLIRYDDGGLQAPKDSPGPPDR